MSPRVGDVCRCVSTALSSRVRDVRVWVITAMSSCVWDIMKRLFTAVSSHMWGVCERLFTAVSSHVVTIRRLIQWDYSVFIHLLLIVLRSLHMNSNTRACFTAKLGHRMYEVFSPCDVEYRCTAPLLPLTDPVIHDQQHTVRLWILQERRLCQPPLWTGGITRLPLVSAPRLPRVSAPWLPRVSARLTRGHHTVLPLASARGHTQLISVTDVIVRVCQVRGYLYDVGD